MSEIIAVRVEVPVCAFRPYASREYQDTYPVPPPATVYGMLLSLLGVIRQDKTLHRGIEMALAVPPQSEYAQRARVFRKLRRGKNLEDTRPDYQDLLLDLKLWIWLRPGTDQAKPPLCNRVWDAVRNPDTIQNRFGGLSLGESSYLVDVICIDQRPPDNLRFIIPDKKNGFYSMPVWVDHQIRSNTILQRFQISEPISVSEGLATAWIRIGDHQ